MTAHVAGRLLEEVETYRSLGYAALHQSQKTGQRVGGFAVESHGTAAGVTEFVDEHAAIVTACTDRCGALLAYAVAEAAADAADSPAIRSAVAMCPFPHRPASLRLTARALIRILVPG